MRYRKLDARGDRIFGHQQDDFYIDEPRAVAQACMTRLMLYFGDWFLDTQDGTKWFESVLGYGTESTRDLEIQSRVLGTLNCTGINDYVSTFDGATRAFRVSMMIETAFGLQPLVFTLDTTSGTVYFTLNAPNLGILDGPAPLA